MSGPTIHASCVQWGGRGVLIRGESGAGKSALAHMMLMRAPVYGAEAMLVADDRVLLELRDGVLMARAPEALAGLLEVRGLGVVRFPHLADTRLDLVIDLVPEQNTPRMPITEDLSVGLHGVTLPRAFACGPTRGLDVLLTVTGHAGSLLDPYVALASVRFDGKTERP